jgi:DNA-directed RNA polymerase subunit M/transcription elongation factor TFIIS
MMTRPRSHAPKCPACGTQELLTVTLTVDDAPMEFTTCHTCERRWWSRDGELVPLGSLLGLVGKR